MYLVIDRGNTRTKIALFGDGDTLAGVRVLESFSVESMGQMIDELASSIGTKSIDAGIYSSVVADDREAITYLSDRIKLIVLTASCPLPVTNLYSTPETLGNDRIAAAVAATTRYPECDVLTIDAGTCITYDFVTADKEYLGGGISPGISMRFKALHTFTSKLPLVSLDTEVGLIGDTTVNSIRSGVFHGILSEMNGIIEQYKINHPHLKIILTGGDANYFDKNLKNDIFAVPNLVLMGLKDILVYNVEK